MELFTPIVMTASFKRKPSSFMVPFTRIISDMPGRASIFMRASITTMAKTILRFGRGDCLLWLAFIATRCLAGDDAADPTLNEQVGRGSDGRVVTPVNQVVISAGTTVDLPE